MTLIVMDTECELVNDARSIRSRSGYREERQQQQQQQRQQQRQRQRQRDDSSEWSNSSRRDPSGYVSDSSGTASESNDSACGSNEGTSVPERRNGSNLPTPFSIDNILARNGKSPLSLDEREATTQRPSTLGGSSSPSCLVRPTAIAPMPRPNLTSGGAPSPAYDQRYANPEDSAMYGTGATGPPMYSADDGPASIFRASGLPSDSSGYSAAAVSLASASLLYGAAACWFPQSKPTQFFGLHAPKPSGPRSRKPRIDRKPRQAYSAKQLERLEGEFKVDKYLSVGKRMELSKSLGLTEVQIKTWFQNRRTKWKKQLTSSLKIVQRQGLFAAAAAAAAAPTYLSSSQYPALLPYYAAAAAAVAADAASPNAQ